MNYTPYKPPKTKDTDAGSNRLEAARRGLGGQVEKWVKRVKRYKLAVIRKMSPRDVMNTVRTIVHAATGA